MRLRIGRVVAVIAVTGFAVKQPVAAQSIEPTSYELTGIFRTTRIHESSGVASSRRQPGVFWTHNDSGDKARVYAFNRRGEQLGRFRVRGADSEDWEDIALGPCPDIDQEYCLFIADTGDNNANRESVVIYIVQEPVVPDTFSDTEIRTRRAKKLVFTYPDGPRDVEALAVASTGDLLLITKGRRGPAILYKIPAAEVGRDSTQAVVVDTLEIVRNGDITSLVTGASVSPDGEILVVRTYTALFFYAAEPDGSWHPLGRPCWIGLRQPQGEAVDFVDTTSFVLTSESAFGRNGGIAVVTCPIGSQ